MDVQIPVRGPGDSVDSCLWQTIAGQERAGNAVEVPYIRVMRGKSVRFSDFKWIRDWSVEPGLGIILGGAGKAVQHLRTKKDPTKPDLVQPGTKSSRPWLRIS